MQKKLVLKMIKITLSINTIPNLRYFSTTKKKSLSDDERKYLSESIERAGALMMNLRMHRNDIYECLDECGENEEAQGELQDQLRELWTETEFAEDAIDINRFLLYGQEPGIKNFESWSRIRNDIGAYNTNDNVDYNNLYRQVEQVIWTTYPRQELDYQMSITESSAPYNPIQNESESETSEEETIESSQDNESENERSEQENVDESQANEPENERSEQENVDESQASNSSLTDDQEDLGSVFENMFDPNSDMHKTTNTQENSSNKDSATKDSSSNSDSIESSSNKDYTAQVNTSIKSVPAQDFDIKDSPTKKDSFNKDSTKEDISNNNKGGSSDDGKGGPANPQGGGSLLDDFADTSTELPDYIGGDD